MSGSTLIGFGFFGGICIGGAICWVASMISDRMRDIREHRRTLAGLRPRRTAELASTHRSVR